MLTRPRPVVFMYAFADFVRYFSDSEINIFPHMYEYNDSWQGIILGHFSRPVQHTNRICLIRHGKLEREKLHAIFLLPGKRLFLPEVLFRERVVISQIISHLDSFPRNFSKPGYHYETRRNLDLENRYDIFGFQYIQKYTGHMWECRFPR